MNNTDDVSRSELSHDLTAVLLVGGKSRRMGYDKALLCLDGLPIAQLLATRLRELTDHVLLSANEPSAYAFLGLPVVTDIYRGCGPMAGLHAAMIHTTRSLVLVLACDLPNVSAILLRRLIEHSPGFDAVVPATSGGRLHPVCAVYRRTCLPVIEASLRLGENQMVSLFKDPRLRVRQLKSSEGAFSDADLLDVNSPADLQKCPRLSKP